MSILRSTRGRLVVTAVAIFAIALVVADSVVLAAVNAFQWQETDAVLVAQAQLLVASAQDSNGQLSFDPSDLPGETPSGIAVDAALIAGNAVVSQTRNQPLSTDALVVLARKALSTSQPVSVDLVDTRHVPRRAYAMPVSGGSSGEVLVVSRSVVELLQFQGRTMASLLVVSIVLLIMGGALTYWLAAGRCAPSATSRASPGRSASTISTGASMSKCRPTSWASWSIPSIRCSHGWRPASKAWGGSPPTPRTSFAPRWR